MQDYKEFRFPNIPGIEKIVADFYEDTRTRDVECLLAVNKNGKIIAANAGDDHTVQVPEAARGCFVIHSHPHYASPVSIPDVGVIISFDLLGNMAVCSDGTLSWTSGCMIPGWKGSAALHYFQDDPKIHMLAAAVYRVTKGDEHMTDEVAAWFTIKELFDIGGLKDFHFRAGSDTKALEFMKRYSFEPPQQFSVYNPDFQLQ